MNYREHFGWYKLCCWAHPELTYDYTWDDFSMPNKTCKICQRILVWQAYGDLECIPVIYENIE